MGLSNQKARRGTQLVCTGLIVLFAVAPLGGCVGSSPSKTKGNAPAASVAVSGPVVQEPDAGAYFRLPTGVGFRDWGTKNSTLAQAEKFLKVKVRAPADTLGRELVQIYTLEETPDGTPVERFDQAAILDYGDFTVGFDVCGSVASAQAWVDADVYELDEEVGLARHATVNGKSAAVRTKGEVPMKVDASGKVVRYGVTSGGNVVSWAEGSVYVSISSATVSSDDLLIVAESIDYR